MATLSGTWLFNKTLYASNSIEEAVNFTFTDTLGDTINCYKITVNPNYNFMLTYYYNENGTNYGHIPRDGTGAWIANIYRIITFTDEQTVTDEFYTWFTANAKPMITDLTGYTVTVPADWSAEAGYGKFSLAASSEFGDGDEFYIGYYDTDGVGNVVPTANKCGIFNSGFPVYTPVASSSFSFTITGGNDVSSSSLIQWFVDNNATFEKTGGEEEPDIPEEPSIPTTPHGEIYYKGNLVATLVEGETIVLHTKDFKFLGDIVIKNVGELEETPTLISFTIDGVEYKAEEGMTWGEWLPSDYNRNHYLIVGASAGVGTYVADVLSTDLIVSGNVYYTEYLSGGGSN